MEGAEKVWQQASDGTTISFECPGDAQFPTREHANAVADDLEREFGTIWTSVLHAGHYHVCDTGLPVGESDGPRG